MSRQRRAHCTRRHPGQSGNLQGIHGLDPHSRRTHAQPQEHQPRPAAAPADRHHRAVRLGQELARVRHALRRRPAPLRRVAVGVRAAVPAADGEARRRPDRGPVAGDLDRAEGDVAQPALDGGHGHRDPRLPAPALRARRRSVLSRPSGAEARGDDHLADGRRDARAVAGGHEADDPRAGRGQPQGRAGWSSSSSCARKGFVRVRVDGKVLRDRRRAEARQEHQAHDRGRRRPAARCAPSSSSGSPSRSRRRCATATAARSRSRWTRGQRAPLLGASSRARSATTRCPSSSRGSSRSTTRWARARAATAWARSASSIPSASSPFRSSRSRRARSRAGTGATSSTSRCCRASPSTYGFDLDQPFAQAARARAAGRAVRLAATRRSRSVPVRARQADDARARVRGHHPQPRAPLPRDRLADGARGARQVSERASRAPSATARGCGARRAT